MDADQVDELSEGAAHEWDTWQADTTRTAAKVVEYMKRGQFTNAATLLDRLHSDTGSRLANAVKLRDADQR